jgi:hypothetical protein
MSYDAFSDEPLGFSWILGLENILNHLNNIFI